MAIGRITGSVLKSNLTRNGVDLAFETNLLYLDVTNSRVGIGTSEPSTTLHVVGTTTITGALNISGALTAGSFSPDTISVNNLSSADSTAIQINDAVNVSGTLTAKTFVTSELSSEDSTAIQINDGVTVSGTLTANTFVTNNISSSESSAIQIDDALNVQGTLTANTIQTNELSSTESTAIQVNDSLNASGTITAASFVTHGTSGNITGVNNIELNQISSNDSTAVQVADGMNVSGTLTAATFVTNDISSSDSTAIQVNDGLNVSGTLIANGTLDARTIVTNDISSSDSTAIQVNDSVNISGTLNAKTIVVTNISSEDSTAVSINDGLNVSGTAKINGLTYPSVDGTDGQVLTTNGAGTLTFTTVTGGGGGGSSATDTITFTGFGSNNTTVDSNITVGSIDTSNNIASSVKVFDSFAETTYDSAFYFATTFNDSSSEVGTRMVSLLTDGTSAYNSPGIGVDNGTTSHISFSSSQTGSTVALNAIGNSSANTATFYRIGLGSETTEATSGNTSTIINNDIDNSPATVDANVSVGQVDTSQAIGSTTGVVNSFDPTTIDSAFYFAVTEDTTNGELGTAQISLVHNTTDAFVSTGAVTKTGTDEQLLFSASVHASGNIRLSATGSSPTNTTRFYKIGLGDSTTAGSSGNTATIINADVDSTEENIDTWSAATYRGARYYISCTAGNGEVSNIEALVVHDGVDAYISTFNEVFSGNNSIITLTADISAGNVRLRASCSTNTVVRCYRIRLGDAESTSTTTYNQIVGAVSVSSSATAIDTFSSSEYAVAHYVVVGYNSTEAAASISDVYVVTDGADAFVSNSSVSSKLSDQLTFTVSHDGSDTVTLSAASTSGSSTTVNAYRTQLARADTLATSTTVDSWSKTSYRGAKYFISIKAPDANEVNNMEAMVIHDGTNAFVSVYNEVYSGASNLATLTAEVSGSNVQLNASSQGERKITFTMYRILLGDAEVAAEGTHNNVIGATTVSSAATTLDTFSTSSYVGAHYVVVAHSSAESAASISEVFVATDGISASVANNFVSSKNSEQLTFTVDYSSGTVTLSAASTSGSSTTVNAYRTHLGRPPAASEFKVIDSWSISSYRMAKYIIAIKGIDIGEFDGVEATIIHDGSDAFISTYNLTMSGSTYAAPGMITLSADVSGGLARLKGVSAGEQNMRVTAVRHRVPI